MKKLITMSLCLIFASLGYAGNNPVTIIPSPEAMEAYLIRKETPVYKDKSLKKQVTVWEFGKLIWKGRVRRGRTSDLIRLKDEDSGIKGWVPVENIHLIYYMPTTEGVKILLNEHMEYVDSRSLNDFVVPEVFNTNSFEESYETIWSCLIQSLENHDAIIESQNKGSGVIFVQAGSDPKLRLMECKTIFKDKIRRTDMRYKILVQNIDKNKTVVTIETMFWAKRGYLTGTDIPCYSNGRLEEFIFNNLNTCLTEFAQ